MSRSPTAEGFCNDAHGAPTEDHTAAVEALCTEVCTADTQGVVGGTVCCRAAAERNGAGDGVAFQRGVGTIEAAKHLTMRDANRARGPAEESNRHPERSDVQLAEGAEGLVGAEGEVQGLHRRGKDRNAEVTVERTGRNAGDKCAPLTLDDPGEHWKLPGDRDLSGCGTQSREVDRDDRPFFGAAGISGRQQLPGSHRENTRVGTPLAAALVDGREDPAEG